MASSLVVEDPSISKISARPTDKSSCKGHQFQAYTTSWRLLLACLLPLQLYHYGHQTVREKLYSSFSLFMAYMCTEYRLVLADTVLLQRSVTFRTSSARARLVLYEFVLTIKKFGMVRYQSPRQKNTSI